MFEAFVSTLAKEMPVSSIAALVNEHGIRIWRILHLHIAKAYANKDFSKLAAVGIDDTSSHKGYKYISIFTDMDKHEVVYATPGKDENTTASFAEELQKHNGNTDSIANVSINMSPALIKGVKSTFKNDVITFDKFHLVRLLMK